MLAGLEGSACERMVGRNRRGQGDRLDRGVAEQGVHVGLLTQAGVAAANAGERPLVAVANGNEIGLVQLVEVPHEIGAPVAEPDHRDSHRVGAELAVHPVDAARVAAHHPVRSGRTSCLKVRASSERSSPNVQPRA